MLIISKDMVEIDVLKVLLKSEIEMKDLGRVKKILGMNIFRDRNVEKLYFSLKRYIEKVFDRFGISTVKSVFILLIFYFKFLYYMSLKMLVKNSI